MRDYIIMTDSCGDLPWETVQNLNLTVLPLSFTLSDSEKEYFNHADNSDMTPQELYTRLRAGATGKTSAVSVGVFQMAMTEAAKAGKDVLCINLSSGLSTTYQSACIAAGDVMDAYPDCTIYVVDSLAGCLGEGMLVEMAALKKQEGATLTEVRDYVESKKLHIAHWIAVNDLFHLKRGGRLSATAAVFGTMLQMKPVIHVDNNGKLEVTGKVRGRNKSLASMLERMDKTIANRDLVYIAHADAESEAELLANTMKGKLGIKEVRVVWIGPVIGNHAGPDTIAVFFDAEER